MAHGDTHIHIDHDRNSILIQLERLLPNGETFLLPVAGYHTVDAKSVTLGPSSVYYCNEKPVNNADMEKPREL